MKLNIKQNKMPILNKQSGIVLYLSLVMLITLAILGLAASRGAITQSLITSNAQAYSLAAIGAEKALLEIQDQFYIDHLKTGGSNVLGLTKAYNNANVMLYSCRSASDPTVFIWTYNKTTCFANADHKKGEANVLGIVSRKTKNDQGEDYKIQVEGYSADRYWEVFNIRVKSSVGAGDRYSVVQQVDFLVPSFANDNVAN